MKSLWIKYLAFSIGVCIITLILYQISAKTEPVYPILTKRYTQLHQQKGTIKAITLGSSHSVAIDFASLGLNGYHLWDFGEDLFESEFKVNTILPLLPELNLVLLCLPYPIFQHDNSYSSIESIYRNRTKLHYIQEQFSLIRNDIGSFVSGKLSPIARYDHWVFFPKHLLFSKESITPVKETLSIEYLGQDGNMRGEVQGFTDNEELAQVSRLKLQEHIRYITNTQARTYTIINDTQATLQSIIDTLQQRGIQLVLYTPPFHRSYLEQYPKEFSQVFRKSILAIESKNTITYLDYATDSNFIDHPQYFQDGNHLSTLGSVVFSKQLAHDLSRLNIP